MKEFGEYLKSERLSQGLTLDAMSDQTCISVGMLQCLEEGTYERIGTALLIRSFIRSYCLSLGIDAAPLLEKHREAILSYDRQKEAIRQYQKWARRPRNKIRIGVVIALLFIATIAASLLGGVFLYKWKNRLSDSQNIASNIPQQELPSDLSKLMADRGGARARNGVLPPNINGAVDSQADGGATANKTAPQIDETHTDAAAGNPSGGFGADSEVVSRNAGQASAPGVTQKHQLEIETSRKVWIKLKIDGSAAQTATLKAGEKREWEAKDTVQLETKNASGVRIKWDGAPVPTANKPGRALVLRLPGEDPAAARKEPGSE